MSRALAFVERRVRELPTKDSHSTRELLLLCVAQTAQLKSLAADTAWPAADDRAAAFLLHLPACFDTGCSRTALSFEPWNRPEGLPLGPPSLPASFLFQRCCAGSAAGVSRWQIASATGAAASLLNRLFGAAAVGLVVYGVEIRCKRILLMMPNKRFM